ncbi:hypothetical protein CI610_00384 [invertebrate metagenome]|uniref:Uncharacterized protein n=1 Tax=invertebrate metagenome TaxID=1711999 RepID=A0A2H9TBL7_9ZZZZ
MKFNFLESVLMCFMITYVISHSLDVYSAVTTRIKNQKTPLSINKKSITIKKCKTKKNQSFTKTEPDDKNNSKKQIHPALEITSSTKSTYVKQKNIYKSYFSLYKISDSFTEIYCDLQQKSSISLKECLDTDGDERMELTCSITSEYSFPVKENFYFEVSYRIHVPKEREGLSENFQRFSDTHAFRKSPVCYVFNLRYSTRKFPNATHVDYFGSFKASDPKGEWVIETLVDNNIIDTFRFELTN